MKIFLDVGNSGIKWLLGGEQKMHGADSLDELAKQWQALAAKKVLNITTLLGANVRGAEAALGIDVLAMKHLKQKVAWQFSGVAACGVRNAYIKPQDLGVDRWAALLAAHKRSPHSNCIVVDAGTAITVDLLDATGQHRGGAIIPGFRSMLSAFAHGAQLRSLTSHLLRDQQEGKTELCLANNTQDALMSGASFAVQGGVMALIKAQCQAIDAEIKDIRILITGGDALLLCLEGLKVEHIPNLVIEGLQLLGENSAVNYEVGNQA